MKRPILDEIPVGQVMQEILGGPEARGGKGMIFITMSSGQWDALLSNFYDAGHTLLELDKNERPIRAYRRKVTG